MERLKTLLNTKTDHDFEMDLFPNKVFRIIDDILMEKEKDEYIASDLSINEILKVQEIKRTNVLNKEEIELIKGWIKPVPVTDIEDIVKTSEAGREQIKIFFSYNNSCVSPFFKADTLFKNMDLNSSYKLYELPKELYF